MLQGCSRLKTAYKEVDKVPGLGVPFAVLSTEVQGMAGRGGACCIQGASCRSSLCWTAFVKWYASSYLADGGANHLSSRSVQRMGTIIPAV